MNKSKYGSKGDYLLLILVVVVAVFGCVMVYSASSYVAKMQYGDSCYFLKKQVIGVLLGICGMIFACNFDYKNYIKLWYVALIVGVISLVLVFTPLGISNYGATRWLGFGSFTIQPSELAKFCFIIFASGYFALNANKAKSFVGILPVLIGGGLMCVLIMLEPNMSITMCVGMLMLVLIFCAGVKIKHLLIICLPAIALVPILIIIEPYRLNRLSAYLNPWSSPKGEGYQLIQSLYAIGSGGWFGVGLFNSRQKLKFLPFSESDFILSVICEELGFIGVVMLFVVLFYVVYKGIKIAINCNTFFGYLVGVGISSIFAIQVILNALVVSGSIPPTGLPLPLISSGNTSLIVFMFAFGILLNISKDKKS